MRHVWLALFLVGCGGSKPAAPAGGLAVHVQLSPSTVSNEVAIASAMLHVATLTAASDRAAADPRATASALELTLGGAADASLPTAPPGLYATVDARLGDSGEAAIDVQGVWHTARVHATIAAVAFDVGCQSPVRLDPGQKALLTLRSDPASWFAGIDLSAVASDVDDNGIVISDDDNRDLAKQLVADVVGSFALDCAPQ
jgi:hypothetical protein